MKRGGYLILSVALTGVVGFLLYRSVPDWGEAWDVMISGQPLWFAAGLGFVSIHMMLRAARWGILLVPVKPAIAFKNLLSLTLVKYVLNVIPPRVGEFAGSVLLARKEKISGSSVIAASMFERVLDAVAALVLFCFYLVFFAGSYVPSSPRGQEIFATVRATTIAGIAVMAAVFVVLAVVLRSRRWQERVPRVIRRHVLAFVDGLRAMQSRSAAARALLLSLLIWLAISAQLWCFVRAYLESFPPAGALLIMALTVLGVMIPTPGGVGGFQFFMNIALVHFFHPYLPGADPESQAAGISNGVYLISMVPVILTGLVLLHREGLSFGRAAQLASAPGDAVEDCKKYS